MTCNDVPGRVEEWHNPGKTVSECTTDRKHRPYIERLSTQHQTVLATFLGFRKPLYSMYRITLHRTQFTVRPVAPHFSLIVGVKSEVPQDTQKHIITRSLVCRVKSQFYHCTTWFLSIVSYSALRLLLAVLMQGKAW